MVSAKNISNKKFVDLFSAMINWKKISFIILLLVCFSGNGETQAKYSLKDLEIALPSLNGDTIKLTSLAGKVILIDFWASWCGPCRVSNKQLVKVYEKYRKSGFEIFGISLDENKMEWEKAVKKDKIKWVQVIDRGGREGGTAIRWKISQIPTSYLLDKDGKLLVRDPDKNQLERLLNGLLN